MSTPTQPAPDHKESEPPAASPRFPVVGIGASAGGLEALQGLTSRLAIDGMAFVVLQHLAPHHQSLLPEILRRDSLLEVVTVEDGLALRVNAVFVAPPSVTVELEHGVFRLRAPSPAVPRLPIDALFRSLAEELGPMAIGVVLSGAGADGTSGLRAIKHAGGIAFAQEPATASQPSMPRSAIDAGVVDYILPPAEIGDELMRLGAHPFVARPRPTGLLTGDALSQIFGRLRDAYGVDFGAYKSSTIERRIARRMALQKIEQVDQYLRFLETSPTELDILYSDVLIGVTSFFRDPDAFQYLKEVVFPRLLVERTPEQPIRIWVAGCATGEEAYSVAIILLEVLGERALGCRIQIFATDLDDDALDVARHGIYPPSTVKDLSPDRLQRFFARTENGYQVSRQLRDLVVFARHNLGKDPPFSRLDLATCRNVLIYMQSALQRQVLRVFHYALNPEGFLLLGTSESVGDSVDLFSLVAPRLKVYQKKNAPSTAVFDFAFDPRREPRRRSVVPAGDHRPVVSIQQMADRKAIERFAPPGVLLNEQLEVVQFRGQTGPFLAPMPGVATLNVFKLARHELLVELRATIEKVISERTPQISAEIPAWDHDHGPITIDVMPVHDATAHRECLLVSFRQATLPAPAAPVPRSAPSPDVDSRVVELERELTTTRDYLETIVLELEGANEALQSANEELQSSNEELQSTNEELETSKEELQSTNEELATVNDELQSRMTQLATSTDDLDNLLAHATSVVVLVNSELKIRRFSASAERVLNLIPSDAGRPVSHLDNALRPTRVEDSIRDTLRTMTPLEQRVRVADGTWYTMRTSPCHTADRGLRGAMIELARLAPVRKGDAPEVAELEGRLLSALRYPLVLLDAQLRIVFANRRFFERFQFGTEILGIPLDEVWRERPGQEAFWKALQELSATGAEFHGLRVPQPFGKAELGELFCEGHRVAAEGERPALALLAMSEASEG